MKRRDTSGLRPRHATDGPRRFESPECQERRLLASLAVPPRCRLRWISSA